MGAFLKLITIVILSFALISFSEAQQRRRTNITRGSSLTPTQTSSWLSSSGMYAFGFYPEGNGFSVGIFLAGISKKTVVWTFNRDNPPVPATATFRFTSDGRLALESGRGELEFEETASSASMLDSGNFVLYSSVGDVVWQSFDYPTDTLLPGQRLRENHDLDSSISLTDHSTGTFKLSMLGNGNLVQMPSSSEVAYWTTDTSGNGTNVTMLFDDQARLRLVNNSGVNFYNITDTPYSATVLLARIDNDGIFRVYSYKNESWSVEWSSSVDKCSPKGLCGFNSYCVLNDQVADCMCLPGFDFVQQGNWTAGCVRSFLGGGCLNKTDVTIEEVANTEWESNVYFMFSVDSKEGCRRACLEDCECEAVFYKARGCNKQRLPLRNGRRSNVDSNTALVKVYTPPSSSIAGATSLHKKIQKYLLIISVFLVSLGFVAMAVSLTVVLCKFKIWGYRRIDHTRCDIELLGEEVTLKSFTFKELERITGEFKEEIGRGSFGTVYKGEIGSGIGGREVAVKRLEKMLEEGEQEFQNEMRAIGRTYHKNLVCLVGYCHDGPNRLLVYEYMRKGSLAEIIFSRPGDRPNWDERVGIASGVGKGIMYLHEECETQIIHCDIKPQNILMDEYGCAKISDFGLAKLLKADKAKTFTGIRGTRGYVAPEWHRKQPITVKADVYSYGIVLLEIICCRRSVDEELPEEEATLEDWAYECFEMGEVMRLVKDEDMVDKRQLEKMIKVALWCIQDEPSLRPSMNKVLLMLEGTVDIPTPPAPQFFS